MPDTKHSGLTSAQVQASRAQHGSNVLTPPPSVPLWRQFLTKFSDPLIIILCVAGVLSIGISIYEYSIGGGFEVFFEPIGIILAVFLATGLAFVFEQRAGREFAVLNRINDDEPVRVIRDGAVTEVPRRDIVVGDIILLGTGDEVPADARLLESTQLTIDESSLTGEPLCHKSADPAEADPEATYASDRVLRGTKVMEGHAVAQATAVGDATENGRTMQATHIDNGVKAGLVGAYDGGGSHCLAGVEAPHEILGAEHTPHAVGEAEGHCHRQSLGDGYAHERYGEHECL